MIRFTPKPRLFLLLACALAATACSNDKTEYGIESWWSHVIDASGPLQPWGKGVGDIDGDGRPDLLLGGRERGGLVWYRNPDWRKSFISTEAGFGTDIEVADIDGDGKADVVAILNDVLVWYRAGDWRKSVVDRVQLHDIEIADLNGDGKPDIVARDQSAFGGEGEWIYLFVQHAAGGWLKHRLRGPLGEGLAIADIDGDGRRDVVVNGAWFKHPGRWNGDWPEYRYAASWDWPHAYVAVGDVNGDGRVDIAAAPSERAGERYRLSWFEAPADRRRPWREHVLDAEIEAVHHFIAVGDVDRDGAADIVAAEMHQGADPDEIKIYLNGGRAGFQKRVLSTAGSHSMRLVDIDGDGDLDLFGANWSGDDQAPVVWENTICPTGPAHWRRQVIDAERPGQAVFVYAADLDGDSMPDIVSGGWWYRNPGTAAGPWRRSPIGEGANNIAAVFDFDGDGDVDLLATEGSGAEANASFALAQNDGQGTFAVHRGIAQAQGDFLQGVAVGRFGERQGLAVVFSWHEPGHGVQMLQPPRDVTPGPWSWRRIASESQDEQLSAGDIDGDGDLDLLLGTRWLRNDGQGWSLHLISDRAELPDRNRLADVDGDGRLDAVVGFEAINRPGDVVWYRQEAGTVPAWREHRIARVIGPMSLDVADMDGDGDLDVVVGEHNTEKPATARMLVFENLDGRGGRWRAHLVHRGDEHHDGAVVDDIDGDGDPDIVSIGWSHRRVLLYENTAPRCPATSARRAVKREQR